MLRSLHALLALTLGCATLETRGGGAVSGGFTRDPPNGWGQPLALDVSQDGGAVLVGTSRGLTALTAEGQVRWSAPAEAWIGSVSASADGRVVAFGTNEGQATVLDGATGAAGRTFSGQGRVLVDLSADGALLATGDASGAVVVWDLATGSRLWGLSPGGAEVKGLAWAPDGARLAAVDWNGRLRLGSPDGETTLPAGPRPSYNLDWSHDGRLLAVAGRPVLVIDVETRGVAGSIEPGSGRAQSVRFSPDDQALAGGLDRGRVALWTLPGGEERLLDALGEGAPALAWVDRALWVADEAVARLDPAGERERLILPLLSRPVAVSAAGGRVAVASAEVVVVFDEGGRPVQARAADTGRIRLLGLGADGRLWTAEATGLRGAGPEPRTIQASRLGPAALRADAAQAAGALQREDRGWDLAGWDLASGAELWRADLAVSAPDTVAWSADGAWVAVSGAGQAEVFQAGQAKGRRAELTRGAGALVWSPVAAEIASGTADRRVLIWDPRDGATLRTLRGSLPGQAISRLAWSPDGALLAAAARDPDGDKVYLWDARKGRRLAGPLANHADGSENKAEIVHGLAWSPDGRQLGAALGAGPNRGRVVVWDAEGGLSHAEEVSEGAVSALAWTEDSAALIAAVGDGGYLRLRRSD